MMKVSKSSERHTFQKEMYIKRKEEEGEEPSQAYLDMFDQIKVDDKHKWDDPNSIINNMEYDLLTTEWILEKVRKKSSYAQNLYAALCNNVFIKNDVWPILTEQQWSCSWRYAGGIIADMQEQGDYIDWYCSGIRNDHPEDLYLIKEYTPEQLEWIKETKNYVGEGYVTDEIQTDLLKLGWIIKDIESSLE